MKRFFAILLTLALVVGMTGTLAFAEDEPISSSPDSESSSSEPLSSSEGSSPEESSPETSSPAAAFLGGGAITPLTPPPASMNAGDTITFSVGAANFQELASFNLNGLTAVVTGTDAASFERIPFWRENGVVYFGLKAKTSCASQIFSVYVTNGTQISTTYSLTTAIADAQAVSSQPESSSSSQPESSSSSQPESSSSSQPESSSSSQSESSSSSQSESSSSSQSESSSSSQSESSSSSQPESRSSPQSEPEENTGILGGIASFFAALLPTQIVDGITGTNPAGPAWEHVSGITNSGKPSSISEGASLIFYIPDGDFAYTAGTPADFATNLGTLNATYKSGIKITSGTGADLIAYFDPEFVNVGTTANPSFGVNLKVRNVPADGKLLPAGTEFSFAGAANKFALTYPLSLTPPPHSGSTKAIGIAAGSQLDGTNTWVSKNGSYYSSGINVLDDVKQGDEFLIHFYPQFFEWDNGMPQNVTLTSIRGKISLRQASTKNSRVFEKIELANVKGEAVVRIEFKEPLATTREIDFTTTLYLTVGGRRDIDSSAQIEGTLGDEDPEEFYASDKDMDISDGFVGIAEEAISKAKVYIGEGVTLNVPFIRKNAKFYGVAVTNEADRTDDELMDLYPDIVEIYTLHTLGLNGAGTTVTIDTYGGYHVYDADLNYLGQSVKNLPFSEKYYLAVKALNIISDDEEEDEYYDYEYEDEPPLSGDDMIPPYNQNGNPATGA